MSRRIEEAVFVEAPARLHFGVLDLRGALGRWFGGIGAAAPAPTLLVSAVDAEALEVEGDDAERASSFAAQVIQHYRLTRGARIRVHRALPTHVGLGSGTQLALAVARALTELHGVEADAPGTGARGRPRAPVGHRHLDVWRRRAGGRGRPQGGAGRRGAAAGAAAVSAVVALRRGRAARAGRRQRRGRGAGDGAAAVAARRRRGARGLSRADGAAAGARRGRRGDVRVVAERDSGADRRMVGAGAGRDVRAGPVVRPRALHARVGRRRALGRARGARRCTASSKARPRRRGSPSACARRSALAVSSTKGRSAPTARVSGVPRSRASNAGRYSSRSRVSRRTSVR